MKANHDIDISKFLDRIRCVILYQEYEILSELFLCLFLFSVVVYYY